MTASASNASRVATSGPCDIDRLCAPPHIRLFRSLKPCAAFRNLPLARKVALIPTITLGIMALMFFLAARTGEQSTATVQALDYNVFEPLIEAETAKDDITLLQTRLLSLISIGTNENNPAAQRAAADKVLSSLDRRAERFDQFLKRSSAITPSQANTLRKEFATYAARVRDTAQFAAYDASYGALLTGVTNDAFETLRSDLKKRVDDLAQRRGVLTRRALDNSERSQQFMLLLVGGAAVVVLLGSTLVGRCVTVPLLSLTNLMNQHAGGDTNLTVPATDRRDEVGAMARAMQVFHANAVARRLGEAKLQELNMQFDAALNSMAQGMVVWGPDQRVQLVNNRFLSMCGIPDGCIGPDMTVIEFVEAMKRHGLHPLDDAGDLAYQIASILNARQSSQIELEMRPDLLVSIASEPMQNGGAVVTFEDITAKRRNEECVAFLARHDALTGLPNRFLLQERINQAASRLGETDRFAILCLDLDRFKAVNDTLGHGAGDDLLRAVAGRLRYCVRDEDTVARLGGDEFAIIVRGPIGDQATLPQLAERIIASLGSPFEVQGHDVVIGTSIGIAVSEPDLPVGELLKRADVALYAAKEERGTFAFFEAGMDESLRERRGLEADLRLALQRDEFELYYQPLYNLPEDRVTAFETLIRWNSPSRGRVMPGDFIPLAEQTGLIIPIGEWVLRTACAEAVKWPAHIRVAVNVSSVQFKDKRLASIVREVLERTGLAPERLELEITETILLQDSETVLTTLLDLHAMGVRVSMDDFGTGYSSLSYLRRFPFDKLKIDRSFVGDLAARAANGDMAAGGEAPWRLTRSALLIVRAITGLGSGLGITTTAEGVETVHQFEQMRLEGCKEVQGYFIGLPRPASEIASLCSVLDASLPLRAAARQEPSRRVA